MDLPPINLDKIERLLVVEEIIENYEPTGESFYKAYRPIGT